MTSRRKRVQTREEMRFKNALWLAVRADPRTVAAISQKAGIGKSTLEQYIHQPFGIQFNTVLCIAKGLGYTNPFDIFVDLGLTSQEGD